MIGTAPVLLGSAWFLTVTLASLVLVLYRLVDRMYAEGDANLAQGLDPGDPIPEFEIITSDGLQRYTIPDGDVVLALLTSSCSACQLLVDTLVLPALKIPGQLVVAIIEGNGPSNLGELDGRAAVLATAHPRDVTDAFRLRSTPMVVIAKNRLAIASGIVASQAEFEDLLSSAADSSAGQRPNGASLAPGSLSKGEAE